MNDNLVIILMATKSGVAKKLFLMSENDAHKFLEDKRTSGRDWFLCYDDYKEDFNNKSFKILKDRNNEFHEIAEELGCKVVEL